jgi:hypothetical protein
MFVVRKNMFMRMTIHMVPMLLIQPHTITTMEHRTTITMRRHITTTEGTITTPITTVRMVGHIITMDTGGTHISS